MHTAVMDAMIRARIKEHRERAGLSPNALGALIRLSAARIDAYEAGRVPIPLSVLARLSQVLGVPLVSFFDPAPLPTTEDDHAQLPEPC